MKKILSYFKCIALVTLASCYTPEPGDPTSVLIREGTVAVFNSTLNAPKFNIATFRFPASFGSSGSLPNDSRFNQGPWEFTESGFPIPNYTTTYRFDQPPNAIQEGDFLIDTILIDNFNVNNSVVRIRMRGKFLRLNQFVPFDDAKAFENWINAQKNVPNANALCEQYALQAISYGETNNGSSFSIIATSLDPLQPTYTYPSSWPLSKGTGLPLPPFRRSFGGDLDTYTTDFRLGEVFYYEAVNGVKFYVLVANLREGILPPQLLRATFKFSEANNSCTTCDPL
jgi:hypothetical protein